MYMAIIENMMYEASNLFLAPVLLIIVGVFLYAFYSLGRFLAQWRQRRIEKGRYEALKPAPETVELKGYPLFSRYLRQRGAPLQELELFAAKQLEAERIVTRVAPMLGLVATMIPMGPALQALSEGNVQGISDNLIVAFSAVIFGLIAASLTFWISTVRRRWLMTELQNVESIDKRLAERRPPLKDGAETIEGEVREAA